jgi:hypothetical protein
MTHLRGFGWGFYGDGVLDQARDALVVAVERFVTLRSAPSVVTTQCALITPPSANGPMGGLGIDGSRSICSRVKHANGSHWHTLTHHDIRKCSNQISMELA